MSLMNLGQAWGPAELASSEAANEGNIKQEASPYFKFLEQKQRRCSSLTSKENSQRKSSIEILGRSNSSAKVQKVEGRPKVSAVGPRVYLVVWLYQYAGVM